MVNVPNSDRFKRADKAWVQRVNGIPKMIPPVLHTETTLRDGEEIHEIAFVKESVGQNLTVIFFPPHPFVGPSVDGDVLYFGVPQGAHLGPYPYVAVVGDGNSPGTVAEGNSAPYVIIDK